SSRGGRVRGGRRWSSRGPLLAGAAGAAEVVGGGGVVATAAGGRREREQGLVVVGVEVDDLLEAPLRLVAAPQRLPDDPQQEQRRGRRARRADHRLADRLRLGVPARVRQPGGVRERGTG